MTTYVLLDKVIVGSGGASSVTFSSIPQTYTDLVIKMSARTNRSAIEEAMFVEFNGSGGTAYSSLRLYGTGSAVGSDNGASQSSAVFYSVNGGTSTSSTFGSAELYIPNYSGSLNKSFIVSSITENNATAVTTGLATGIWNNSSGITSVKLTPASAGTFQQYSTFYLYGVVNASTAATKKATGGDIITTSGGYTYHAFLTSGTFTPTQTLSCDILVVSGGGGGNLNGRIGAGGGGGGLLYSSAVSFSTAQTVTIGAGGAAAGDSNGGNGSASSIGSNSISVSNGAIFDNYSGNGGVSKKEISGTTTNYTGGTFGTYGGGLRYGGPGASAAANGVGANPPVGANGNNAYSVFATATSTGDNGYYAGGGGGGLEFNGTIAKVAGGLGGGGKGGAGTTNRDAEPGAPNTGGGGGGTGGMGGVIGGVSAAGGSGIVIVRYAV